MISKVKEKCLEDKVNGIMKSSTKHNKKAKLKIEDTKFGELIKVLEGNHERNNIRKFLRILIF